MAAAYKPFAPFSAALILLIPTEATVSGVLTKTFPDPEGGILFHGSFRSFGGTDRTVNGVYSVEDTADVETWYRPDITSNCRIYVPQTGGTYEILGEPENIQLRNQYLKLRVRRVKGGA